MRFIYSSGIVAATQKKSCVLFIAIVALLFTLESAYMYLRITLDTIYFFTIQVDEAQSDVIIDFTINESGMLIKKAF